LPALRVPANTRAKVLDREQERQNKDNSAVPDMKSS